MIFSLLIHIDVRILFLLLVVDLFGCFSRLNPIVFFQCLLSYVCVECFFALTISVRARVQLFPNFFFILFVVVLFCFGDFVCYCRLAHNMMNACRPPHNDNNMSCGYSPSLSLVLLNVMANRKMGTEQLWEFMKKKTTRTQPRRDGTWTRTLCVPSWALSFATYFDCVGRFSVAVWIVWLLVRRLVSSCMREATARQKKNTRRRNIPKHIKSTIYRHDENRSSILTAFNIYKFCQAPSFSAFLPFNLNHSYLLDRERATAWKSGLKQYIIENLYYSQKYAYAYFETQKPFISRSLAGNNNNKIWKKIIYKMLYARWINMIFCCLFSFSPSHTSFARLPDSCKSKHENFLLRNIW